MKRLLLALTLAPLCAAPASGGIFFGKKPPRPSPAERVPQLLMTLKTDGDENKRAAAAEELRQYDPAQFPDMVPALVDALLNDAKPGVRTEAAQTLGKLRPVSQQAGQALVMARDRDASMRVRLQARSSLLDARWHGFKPDKNDLPAVGKEPPLADKPQVAAPQKPNEPARVAPVPEAREPRPMPNVQAAPQGPQRLPGGPALPRSNAEPPLADPAPMRDGPALPDR